MTDPVKPAVPPQPPKPVAQAPKPPAPPPPAKAAAPAPAVSHKGKKLKIHGFQHANIRNPDGTTSISNLRTFINKCLDQAESGHYAYQNEKETPLADGRKGVHISFDFVDIDPKVPGAES